MNSIPVKWLAVTAGVGSRDFEEAALRVRDSLEGTGIVDQVIAVTTADLPSVCPKTSNLYKNLMNTDTRGFGFMSWKAEIVNSAFQGMWGQFDGVVWIDAGCEVTINPASRIKFNKFKNFAIKHGVAAFTLDTLEIEYTKRDVFEIFPEIHPKEAGKQIQTTWFFLHGDLGRTIAQQWLDTVLIGTHLLDLNPSANSEFKEFIENRYDQSTFSLVCKQNQVRIMDYRPTTGSGTVFSRLRGVLNPIWTARNRQGKSTKNRFIQILEGF
jgi:hypothetical protein